MPFPVNFKNQNFVFKGDGDVNDLPVFRNGQCVISKWVFTPEELLEIAATGELYVYVSMPSPPPMSLHVRSPIPESEH